MCVEDIIHDLIFEDAEDIYRRELEEELKSLGINVELIELESRFLTDYILYNHLKNFLEKRADNPVDLMREILKLL